MWAAGSQRKSSTHAEIFGCKRTAKTMYNKARYRIQDERTMSHDYDVLLLGGYFCDLIFTGLPEMPQLGAEVYGSAFDMVPGASYTTALALRRLDLRAGWACDFGDDLFSG